MGHYNGVASAMKIILKFNEFLSNNDQNILSEAYKNVVMPGNPAGESSLMLSNNPWSVQPQDHPNWILCKKYELKGHGDRKKGDPGPSVSKGRNCGVGPPASC